MAVYSGGISASGGIMETMPANSESSRFHLYGYAYSATTTFYLTINAANFRKQTGTASDTSYQFLPNAPDPIPRFQSGSKTDLFSIRIMEIKKLISLSAIKKPPFRRLIMSAWLRG
jgi:hypothetical protein